MAIASVPIGGSVLDLIIRLGWLAERDATDRVKIGAAIARMRESTAP